MIHSFADVAVDFCWWYWCFADTAPVSDPPKES
jgi:hypothetical protein